MFIESITVRGGPTFRICAASAILAGILRAITSFIPEATPRVLLIYLAVDLFLLFGIIGLYGFAVKETQVIPLLGIVLIILALVVLIGRDLGLASANIYGAAAATFSVGLDLFAIHLLQTRTMPSWIPVAWLVSTIIGPVGFFVPQLHILFTISGPIFGMAFAAAGVMMWLRRS